MYIILTINFWPPIIIVLFYNIVNLMVSDSYVPILARLNMPYSENTHHAGHGDAVPNPIHRLRAHELVESKRLFAIKYASR